jgi:predicted nucleic acid-binding protein
LTDRVVVDASVAVKWYIPEDGSSAARALLDTDSVLIAPELLLAEASNVLWKKVRRGEIDGDWAHVIRTQLCTGSLIEFRPLVTICETALEIALQFNQTVYDSMYIALAIAENAVMITVDSRLVTALAGTPLTPFVTLLDT